MSKQTIASAYDSQASDITLRHHWDTLGAECNHLADYLRQTYAIVEVNESEPYATADAMFADLDRGNFKVSAVNCEHPVFTARTNINWRIVHDIVGHYGARAGFSWKGENTAYQHQRQYHSTSAQVALRTEIIGQTASYSVNGKFPSQKLVRV